MTEHVNCPICESENSDFFFDKERNDNPVNFVICKGCGLVYQNPRKTYDEFKAYYEDEFRRSNHIDPDVEKYIESRITVGKEVLALVEHIFYRNIFNALGKRMFGKKIYNVLDVGCGVGGVLFPFKEAGYNCKGIDVASEYTKIGKEKLGIDIEEVFIGDFKPDNKYNIIILNHSLEHFLDPVAYLLKIRSLLADGGVLYIELPDVERPYNWTSLKYFFMLGHVCYYSPSTLTTLLNKCGFRAVWIESEKSAFLRSIFTKKNNRGYSIDKDYYHDFINKFDIIKKEKNA